MDADTQLDSLTGEHRALVIALVIARLDDVRQRVWKVRRREMLADIRRVESAVESDVRWYCREA